MNPDPMLIHPVPGADYMTHVKPTITRPNIIVGDFTYYSGTDFESRVTHHYEFLGDRLIIGKFCQIAAGVEFVMNGANHQMSAVSTYPFYIMSGWEMSPPPLDALPLKGDTVVGNDVWIGQNATILPGVHIGDGAIIGLNSVVASDIPAYAVAAGNPARVVRMRFDGELIALMQRLSWWDRPIDEIQQLIPVLTCPDLEYVRHEITRLLEG
ncbi:MAG: CatB-related O-acetyltransferase [bacterium]